MSIASRERLVGGLLGVLVGDALGVPVEFTGRAVRDQDPVTGMRGFGTWNQPPGTWSDDSSMTLANADALVSEGWDLEAQMRGFLAWYDQGRWTPHGSVFDIGNRTRNSLMLFRTGVDLDRCGGDEEDDNGNGSLMRCLPVSCWLFGRSTAEMVRLAGEASALTHAHARSRLACAWHGLWCDAVLGGGDARGAARGAVERLRRHVPAEERGPLARMLDGTALDLPRAGVSSDGYVVSTLEAAAWCVVNHRDFPTAVLAAVNLGGDADTTGAVAGGMAGLLHGRAAIPGEWLAALARRDEVIGLAERFADACIAEWSSHGPGRSRARP
jgi:ADP-ribosylglycohydrolase